MTAPLFVVFDIDDTLYLERDYVRSGFEAVAASISRAGGPSDLFPILWKHFEDGVRDRIFDTAFASIGYQLSPAQILECVATYRAHIPNISLLPDALRCLERVTGRCAVVSDGPLQSQRNKAIALSLDRWANPIVLTEEHGPDWRKPSMLAFDRIAREHPDFREFVYVADNPLKDFSGPRALGWRTIRIRRRGGLHFDRVSGLDVDQEIDSLDDCLS